jgi:hypothetical protein
MLELVLLSPFQLPVCIIDKNQDPRAPMNKSDAAKPLPDADHTIHCTIKHEHLLSPVFHDVLTEIAY